MNVTHYYDQFIQAVFDNIIIRWLVIAFITFALYILISSHYIIDVQFVIGYGSALFLLLVLQFKKVPEFIKLAVKLLAVVVVMRYMYWRTFDSLIYEGFFDYIGALFLYGAEVVAVIIYLLGIFTSLHLLKRQPIKLTEFDESQHCDL